MSYAILYKRDSKDRPRQWRVWTEGSTLLVETGLVDGAKKVQKTVCKMKNIGKSNETTPEEQAIIEAYAKWRIQRTNEDYNQDIDKAGLQLRPMLALDYKKVPHRVNWPDAVVSTKLDGLRLTVGNRLKIGGWDKEEHLYMSRKGILYPMPHFDEETSKLLLAVNRRLKTFNSGVCCLALDGEAYIHGMPLQKINSLVKSYKPGKTENLEYHLFDLIIPGMSFIHRYEVLVDCLSDFMDSKNLKLVPVYTASSEKLMVEMHDKFVEQGYEGAIIRHASAEYGIGQRSSDLFKRKKFFRNEFKIIKIWPDKNGNAMFTVEFKKGFKFEYKDHIATKDGTFKVTPKRTHVERKEMLNNPDDWVGNWITTKYQDLTEDEIPTFCSGLALRVCTDKGEPLE